MFYYIKQLYVPMLLSVSPVNFNLQVFMTSDPYVLRNGNHYLKLSTLLPTSN